MIKHIMWCVSKKKKTQLEIDNQHPLKPPERFQERFILAEYFLQNFCTSRIQREQMELRIRFTNYNYKRRSVAGEKRRLWHSITKCYKIQWICKGHKKIKSGVDKNGCRSMSFNNAKSRLAQMSKMLNASPYHSSVQEIWTNLVTQ